MQKFYLVPDNNDATPFRFHTFPDETLSACRATAKKNARQESNLAISDNVQATEFQFHSFHVVRSVLLINSVEMIDSISFFLWIRIANNSRTFATTEKKEEERGTNRRRRGQIR